MDVLVTPQLGRVLAGLVILALAFTGWKYRRTFTDTSAFNLMFVLVLAVTVVVVPKAAPYNQVLLLPGILLLARNCPVLWCKNRLTRIISMISWLLIFWPWLAATALTVASLFLPAELVQKGWALPLWTSLAIPLAVVVLLASGFDDLALAGVEKQPDFAPDRTGPPAS
jgi:hypothetical protein